MDNPAKLPAPFPHYLSPTGFTDDLQTRSSSTHVKSVDDSASSGIQPRILETNVSNDERFKPHQSSLPLFLYLLSFAATAQDSIDPTLNKTRSWRETFSHPFVLYGIGTFAAILAGMAFPAFDILYGYWTTGITASTATTSQITARGIQTAWIMAIVGSMILLTTWAFPICCECIGVSVSFEQTTDIF
jgi:ATP-binding cassette subfamily B (MDR/TAP) protein 1